MNLILTPEKCHFSVLNFRTLVYQEVTLKLQKRIDGSHEHPIKSPVFMQKKMLAPPVDDGFLTVQVGQLGIISLKKT